VRVILASIPSPAVAVWHLGPFPLRAYALCIIAGVIAAVTLTERRLQARGGPKGAVVDVAVYAVPFGIVGARIYHVITSPEHYFGEHGHLVDALKIWEGGLGIWGAVAGGALGCWLACRRLSIPLTVLADAVAPGLAVAQAIGRFGNWFNNELYGRSTTLPWGLQVHVMDPGTGRAVVEDGKPVLLPGLYHPTFLYEALWCLAIAAVVLWADKRYDLGRGRAFALYGMLYSVGRAWIEYLRVDEANHILGLRLNEWTCLLVFAGALWYFVTHRGPREQLELDADGKARIVDPATDGADRPADGDTDATDQDAEAGTAPADAPDLDDDTVAASDAAPPTAKSEVPADADADAPADSDTPAGR
jgi:prolipoprotein diacylglyceryl transferase